MPRISRSALHAELAALFVKNMPHPAFESELRPLGQLFIHRPALSRMGDPKLKLPYQSTSREGLTAVDAATAVTRDQRLGGAIVQDFKNNKNPISRTIIA